MSGICGVVDWRGAPIAPQTIHRMADAAKHRAIDGTHTWTSQHAHLAHLAHHVTPEDALERQPLVSHDLVLVTDARIDNRADLIPILRAHLTTDTPTDADLILAAHRHWSDQAPAHLIGDYAYALWNEATRTLVAARDPMGMRALYYHATPHTLTFATEIKQILQAPGVPCEIDEGMVGLYLCGPYDLPERTHYAGIHRVPPGHALTATPERHDTHRYWDIDPDHRIRHTSERDYTEHFLDIFKEAVRARTRSTKPIGIMLSGGMDSGSIASTLGWLREHGHDTPPIHTYSWAFDELTSADERHVSGAIVERYGFEGTDVPADDRWPLKDHPAHGPDRDGPFVRVYQALHERSLDAARSDGVGPLLGGDGGDEAVGDWVFDVLGLLLSGGIAGAWHDINTFARTTRRSRLSIMREHVLAPFAREQSPGHVRRRAESTRPTGRIPDFIDRAWAERIGLRTSLETSASSAAARERLKALRYGRMFETTGLRDPVPFERDCARRALDLRTPWRDRRLASFVMAVPAWAIQRPSDPKGIARRAMNAIMPPSVLRAAGKIEPTALFERGLMDRERPTALALLTDTCLAARGFVDEPSLRAPFEAMVRGEPVRYDPWWALTMEMWLRSYWA